MKARLLIALAGLAVYAGGATAAPTTLTLQAGGTTVPRAVPLGGDAVTGAELDLTMIEGDSDGGDGGDLAGFKSMVNRSIARGHGQGGLAATPAARAKSNPQVNLSFQGLNFFDQRFANGGNQFSVEPPDQGLCAGNGFVLETVNDVLSIYDTAGNKLVGPVDLNTFYGYPAAINRTTGARGPSITDPSCYYDADTQRWFHIVVTMDHVGTTANLTGTNHVDIAVSKTADPTGAWNVYKLPVQNDGTQGTPNHHCALGPCLGDYPHIGADANAIFITTNEFSFFGSGFYGAQIYAISKRALAAGAASPSVVLWNTGEIPVPAFTVWPATSPGSQYNTDYGGTEFLMSSDAVFFDSGTSSEIWVWSITNTSAIDTTPLALVLNVAPVGVKPYAVPTSLIKQKPGNTPLGDCLASSTCSALVGGGPPHVYSLPRSMAVNDSRMQQVMYANGKLWGALDTDVLQGSGHASGVAYFVLNPNSGVIYANDTLSLADASLSYPAVGVTKSGRGVIAFTVAGPNDYPSAGYASLDAKVGAGPVQVAAGGAGPWDGFTGYTASFGSRPRWGDYGAAAVDGNSIWIASEYIAQTCTDSEYLAAPLGQCGGTRGALGNWATRITRITP